jgi:hypothetical protein
MSNKFLQFELWKECNNNCRFCFSRLQKDVDKLKSMNEIYEILSSNIVQEYDTIGFIGGEFFNGQISTVDIHENFYKLINKVIEYLQENTIKQFYITATLVQNSHDDLVEFLDYIRSHNLIDRILLCTSYDVKYRFHNKRGEELWKRSIMMLHNKYPSLKIHVEIICTQALIDAMMSNEFDLVKFKYEYNVSVDFLEPNTAFEEIEEFKKRLPLFLPTRKSFLNWLKRFCVVERIIDINTLFDPKIRSNTCYYHVNGKLVKIDNRHSGDRQIGFESIKIKPHFGYSDSDIDMRDDVKNIKELAN